MDLITDNKDITITPHELINKKQTQELPEVRGKRTDELLEVSDNPKIRRHQTCILLAVGIINMIGYFLCL